MTAYARAIAEWRSPVALTGALASDVARYLDAHGCSFTVVHSAAVAAEAHALAGRFDVDPARARVAGLLHDVGAVVPRAQRVGTALALSLPVLPEEREAPMILHQKLSAVLAEAVFGVGDVGVLEAVRYHTTLHPDAGSLAKVVFLADKVRWDRAGEPPYLSELMMALSAGSLDGAVCVYLGYLWERRATLPVVHPWMAAAHQVFCEARGGGR